MLGLLLLVLLLGGCSSTQYYLQAARGQLELSSAAKPIGQVLENDELSPSRRSRLEQVPDMLQFAQRELGLPHTGSYRNYAEIDRPALVWSVVATPADSLTPHEWCFPIAGCVGYRGYFDLPAAQREARRLAAAGLDVAVQPVPAYSTLGWLDDPLPSTVIDWPISEIAGLIFHELAHVELYVDDDSGFNEAYATTVERVGVERWLARHGTPQQRAERIAFEQRRGIFLELLAETRSELELIYQRKPSASDLADQKRHVFDKLRERYSRARNAWGGNAAYDHWFEQPLNNAYLASIDTYWAWEPAFTHLLQREDGDMVRFHVACRRLGALPPDRRLQQMQALLDAAASH